MSIEDQQFTKWLRRPTEFIASAWFLLASASQYVITYLVMFIELLLTRFGLRLNDSGFSYTVSMLIEVGLFFLPVILYAARHDGVEQSLRMNRPRWDALLLALFAAPVGVMAADCLSTWWMVLIELLGGSLYISSVPIPTNLTELGFALFFSALLPGVCEEMLFRGGLMGAWERRGTRQALMISSVLFALLHGSILGLPVQLIIGFVLGYIVILSDSLFTGMVYHAMHNATILIIGYLTYDPSAPVDQALALTEIIRTSSGFGALIVQTIFWAAAYGGLMTLFVRSQKKRGAQIDRISEGDKEPMSWETLLVLLAGLLTIGVLFMSDLIRICGGA